MMKKSKNKIRKNQQMFYQTFMYLYGVWRKTKDCYAIRSIQIIFLTRRRRQPKEYQIMGRIQEQRRFLYYIRAYMVTQQFNIAPNSSYAQTSAPPAPKARGTQHEAVGAYSMSENVCIMHRKKESKRNPKGIQKEVSNKLQ